MPWERRLAFFDTSLVEKEKCSKSPWRTVEELAEAADLPEEMISRDIKEKRLYARYASARRTPLLPADLYDKYWIPPKEFSRAVDFYEKSKTLPPLGSGGVYEDKPKDELWERVANQKPLSSRPGIKRLVLESWLLKPYEKFLNYSANGVATALRQNELVDRTHKKKGRKKRRKKSSPKK